MLSSGLCLSHWNFFFPLELPSLARCPQNFQPALSHSWGEKTCHPTMADYNQCLMATHSGTLACKIPWTEEPGRLQSVRGVAKSRTLTERLHFHALEKEMATHSSVLAWRIPGTGEPGGLLSMGSHRVGHNWRDLAVAVTHLLMSAMLGILKGPRCISSHSHSLSQAKYRLWAIYCTWFLFSK